MSIEKKHPEAPKLKSPDGDFDNGTNESEHTSKDDFNQDVRDLLKNAQPEDTTPEEFKEKLETEFKVRTFNLNDLFGKNWEQYPELIKYSVEKTLDLLEGINVEGIDGKKIYVKGIDAIFNNPSLKRIDECKEYPGILLLFSDEDNTTKQLKKINEKAESLTEKFGDEQWKKYPELILFPSDELDKHDNKLTRLFGNRWEDNYFESLLMSATGKLDQYIEALGTPLENMKEQEEYFIAIFNLYEVINPLFPDEQIDGVDSVILSKGFKKELEYRIEDYEGKHTITTDEINILIKLIKRGNGEKEQKQRLLKLEAKERKKKDDREKFIKDLADYFELQNEKELIEFLNVKKISKIDTPQIKTNTFRTLKERADNLNEVFKDFPEFKWSVELFKLPKSNINNTLSILERGLNVTRSTDESFLKYLAMGTFRIIDRVQTLHNIVLEWKNPYTFDGINNIEKYLKFLEKSDRIGELRRFIKKHPEVLLEHGVTIRKKRNSGGYPGFGIKEKV